MELQSLVTRVSFHKHNYHRTKSTICKRKRERERERGEGEGREEGKEEGKEKG